MNLRAMQARQVPCTLDLCGIVASFKPSLSFTSKDGKELVKREIIVADDTASSISVTLWGERASQADQKSENNPVVALKGVSVKEFNGGRSGSLLQGGALVFDPVGPDAERVRQWWSQGGSS